MPKTERDIVVDALQIPNLVAINVEPDAGIYDRALSEYKSFHEWLKKEFGNDLKWSLNEVPDEISSYVSAWLAGELITILPVSEGNSQRALLGAQRAETRLREILARRRLKTVQASYF